MQEFRQLAVYLLQPPQRYRKGCEQRLRGPCLGSSRVVECHSLGRNLIGPSVRRNVHNHRSSDVPCDDCVYISPRLWLGGHNKSFGNLRALPQPNGIVHARMALGLWLRIGRDCKGQRYLRYRAVTQTLSNRYPRHRAMLGWRIAKNGPSA